MSGSRERILERLGGAAVPGDSRIPAPSTVFSSDDLWATFEGHLNALGGRMLPFGEVTQYLPRRCFLEPDAAQILQVSNVNPDIWDAEVGISVAVLAVAETGSLIVTAGEGTYRGSSLVPPANIILVRRDSIVGTLAEAIGKIPSSTSAMITGPSRTADIEGVLVRGIHGPSELMVTIID